uniref:Minor tail protein n=1 Tax=Siphoviridae sp. ct3R43 TaxID=2825321 RepID=A0A8S5VG84_9CAUD|nr:MAG TPA: minor tail protein [Siphoviridae sp. ct3R43]
MADNEVQIDSLSVAIEHSAGTASKDLSSLASELRKLQKSVAGLNLNNAIIQFGSLSTAIGGIGNNADKITALASSLLDLKSVGKVSAAVPKSLSNQITALDTALSGVTESDVKRISSLASALTQLSGAKMPQISASIGHQLQSIGDAAKNLQGVNLARFKDLATALQPLSALTPAHLTSFINQLGKFTQLSKDLEAVDMDKFAATIERLTAAMAPLATEMDKIARGSSAFPQRIQTFIKNNEASTKSVKKAEPTWQKFFETISKGSKKSSSGLTNFAKQLFSIATIKKVWLKATDSLESANEYIEALNLFYVSMGSYVEKAQDYANLVGDSYGVDPAEFMKMQATFMDVSKSFGTASGTAYTMSKALTQLTYDISSLYNLKVDESLNKVRSALVGEIEPIRALGKDLSVANLKLLATELGITANVDAMNQSEKAMLRTISLLRQSNSAMGDMARTLEQPANQFRILKAQLTLLGRAIGDLFLPLVQKTLPYMIAFVKVGQRIVSAFAALAGFELPKFDYADSVIKGNEGVADSADDAAKSMKKLYQLSFDELNILGSQNTGASGSGTSAADLAKLEAELNRLAKIEDDMFSKNLGETTDKIAAQIEDWITKGKGVEEWAAGVWEDFKGIKDAAAAVADSLGLWKIPAAIADLAKSLGLDVGSVDFNFGTSQQGKVTGGDTLKNLLGSGLGLALGIGALAVTASSGGVGGLLAKGLGLALGIGAINMLFDGISVSGDTSPTNLLLSRFQKALGLSLAGSSLSLLTGKGLSFSLGLGLGIGAIALWYMADQGVKSGEDPILMGELQKGIAALMGGVSISTLIGGAEGLKAYGIPLGVALAGLSMLAGANVRLQDADASWSDKFRDLLVGTIGGGLLGAGVGGAVAQFLGVGAVGGAGIGFLFAIPIGISLLFGGKFDFKWSGGFKPQGYKDLGLDALDTAKAQIEANKKAAEALSRTNELKQTQQESLNDLAQLADQLQKSSLDSLSKMSESITVGSDTAITNLRKIGSEVNKAAESDIYKPILDKTDKMGTDLNAKGKSAGENVAKGFVAGVDYNADYVAKGMTGMANKAMVQFTDSLGIHSPSTVFEGYGINVDIGFANGVTLGLPNVKDAFGNVWTSIRVDFSAFANSLLASARAFIRQLNQVLSSVSFSGGAAQSLIGKTPRMIPAFATGGFPEDGMFYANSGELVGRFANGRTAVANNAQIIEGIENAVYRAMTAAQRGSGRGGKIELVLDKQVVGRVFGDAIDSEKRRSGANTKITFTNGGRGNG